MKLLSKVSILALIFLSQLAISSEKAPFIFAHGFFVPHHVYTHVVPLKQLFRTMDREIHIAKTPMIGSIEHRGKILVEEIRRLVPSGKFHLIGHSMGGLDARYALTFTDIAERCLSLTTLATPHRGSEIADIVVDIVDHGRTELLSEIPGADKMVQLFKRFMGSVRDLTTDNMREHFNLEVQNTRGVEYYSLGFEIPLPFFFYTTQVELFPIFRFFMDLNLPNDGVVTVESSKWGTYLGTMWGDHISETSQIPFAGRFMFYDVFKTVIKNAQKLERDLKQLQINHPF